MNGTLTPEASKHTEIDSGIVSSWVADPFAAPDRARLVSWWR